MYESDPIYVPYEDGISNRERRSLRGMSNRQRYQNAREAQAKSNIIVRLARPVLNQLDFKRELKVWIPPVQSGIANRRSLGNLAITVFDTKQQPLDHCDHTQESLEDRLALRYPEFFQSTPPIEITGTDLFGDLDRPYKGLHIGLILAPGHAHKEQGVVRQLVAPGLAMDDRHQKDHRPHVSLGQVFSSLERAQEIQRLLQPVIPGFVQFGPGHVQVTSGPQ